MIEVLFFIFLIAGLVAAFQKVVDWFQDTENINIVPAACIEMIAVFIFAFNYGGNSTKEIVWVCVSVGIVTAITIYNIKKYGLKKGALASAAELIFSIAIVFIIFAIIVSRNQKTQRKNGKSK